MALAVQLKYKAGAWSGYWSLGPSEVENANDNSLPPDIRGKATYLDHASGHLLVRSQKNVNDGGKVQSGIKGFTVYKAKSSKLQGLSRSIVDYVPHYLEDGVTIDYYEYTYFDGWWGGDLTHLRDRFYNGFTGSPKGLDLYGSGEQTIYVSEEPYGGTSPIKGVKNCLWEFSNYAKKSGVTYFSKIFFRK